MEFSGLVNFFAILMALSVLIYVVLDGYDLGVGIILPMASDSSAQRDLNIASIGPFWDANETWLVLAAGLLLIAFPKAHSLLIGGFYIPVTVMLIGLTLRGVAFDFRTKAAVDLKNLWDGVFKYASLVTALAQGYMLGRYVVGFDNTVSANMFSLLSAVGVASAYAYIGACWLVMKMSGDYQKRAIRAARIGGRFCFLGVVAVCVANLYVNPGVFSRWFTMPWVMFVLLIPFLCIIFFVANEALLRFMPLNNDRLCWLPFVNCMGVFLCCFMGLSFSFYPYLIPEQLTIWEAASAQVSLQFLFYGVVIVFPVIILYTFIAYRVFYGKASDLRYD